MHATVPVRFGRGRLDSLATKGLAAYLIIGCCPGNTSQVYTSTFPTEFRAGVFGDRLIWHKARPESPVPGESPLAILAFPTGHSWVR